MCEVGSGNRISETSVFQTTYLRLFTVNVAKVMLLLHAQWKTQRSINDIEVGIVWAKPWSGCETKYISTVCGFLLVHCAATIHRQKNHRDCNVLLVVRQRRIFPLSVVVGKSIQMVCYLQYKTKRWLLIYAEAFKKMLSNQLSAVIYVLLVEDYLNTSSGKMAVDLYSVL